MNPPQTNKDEGTYIWLAADCLRRFGVARDQLWPFHPAKRFVNPGWGVMRNGAENKIAAALRVDGSGDELIANLIACLADGKPVVYGTKVGDNWSNYKAGEVLGECESPRGGHATVLVGWDGSAFIGENSWGRSWGDDGFYRIEPAVLTSRASHDFWTATLNADELL